MEVIYVIVYVKGFVNNSTDFSSFVKYFCLSLYFFCQWDYFLVCQLFILLLYFLWLKMLWTVFTIIFNSVTGVSVKILDFPFMFFVVLLLSDLVLFVNNLTNAGVISDLLPDQEATRLIISVSVFYYILFPFDRTNGVFVICSTGVVQHTVITGNFKFALKGT